MSGRKDWSALSSLAQQWSLEDEEEQQRERRRRHRNLISTSEDDDRSARFGQNQNGGRPAPDRLPSVEEAQVPRAPPASPQDEGEEVQAILWTRRERRQRRQGVEAEEGGDSLGPGQAVRPPLTPTKEAAAPPRRRLSQEKQAPWVRAEESVAAREPGGRPRGVPEKHPGSEKKPSGREKRPSSELSPIPERKSVLDLWEKRPSPARAGVSEKQPLSAKAAGLERGRVSEKASIFEKPQASGAKLVPKRAVAPEQPQAGEKPRPEEQPRPKEKPHPQEQPQPKEKPQSQEQPRPKEKPHPQEQPQPKEKPQSQEQPQPKEKPQPQDQDQPKEKPQPEEQPQPKEKPGAQEQPQAQEQPVAGGSQRARAHCRLPSAEPGGCTPPTVASRLRAITLQVKIPSKEEEEEDAFSPTGTTFSSSLRRSSPRTISFRMSPQTTNSETTLTRSASVRLPVKLGEKLERYHTAIKRSVSVKTPGSSRTEVFVAPVGVASRRHLFEKELAGQGPSRPEPASSRKENLTLSGVVTSRLNLWISRTQESGEQDPQEAKKEAAATKRTQWAKRAGSTLDAEV
ncbi:ladinin-1 [Myotis daubentonii]|uniref:ladinin-1 n=1 Tax=Myotis daubentonii TaxID=98922 RepID=UPI002873A06C|nr:ladinin-1 [Myotis daubentonii]